MKKNVLVALKILITALLFVFLFRRIDPQKFYQTLKGAELVPLLLACLVLLASHSLCAIRWRIFLNVFQLGFPFLRVLYVYSVGLFFNLALPTGVGGDLVKFYLAGKESNGSYPLAFASVFLDRDVGVVAIAVAATTFSLILPLTINGIPLLPFLIAITVGFLAVNLVLVNRTFHNVLNRLLRRLPQVAWRLEIISEAFVKIGRHRTVLLKTFLLSLINDLLMGVMGWLIAKSLHVDLPVIYFLVLIPTISLVTMIPVAPGGMGLRENVFQIMFTALGVDPEKSILMGFLSSFIMIILPSLPGGLVYLLFRKRGAIGDMKEAEVAVAGGKLPAPEVPRTHPR